MNVFDISHLTDKRFDRKLGIMLAYIAANEGRHIVMVPGHDVDVHDSAKELCDLRLVHEIGSYGFVTTAAGRAILWGLVLTPNERHARREASQEFYRHRREAEKNGEQVGPAPYEEGIIAYKDGRRIDENPHEGQAAREWETSFLDAFERDAANGISSKLTSSRP